MAVALTDRAFVLYIKRGGRWGEDKIIPQASSTHSSSTFSSNDVHMAATQDTIRWLPEWAPNQFWIPDFLCMRLLHLHRLLFANGCSSRRVAQIYFV